MNRNDELKHYGVIGMKWGRHIHGPDWSYTSHSTKKWNRKANKYEKKFERAKKFGASESRLNSLKKKEILAKGRAEASATHDKRMQKYSDQHSTLGILAKGAVFGSGSMKTYYSLKASNNAPAAHKGRYVAATFLADQTIGGLPVRAIAKRDMMDKHANRKYEQYLAKKNKKR